MDEEPVVPGVLLEQLNQIESITVNDLILGVNALCTTDRSKWAYNRNHLIKLSEVNASNLDYIEKAMFVVSFDDHEPVSIDDVRSIYHFDMFIHLNNLRHSVAHLVCLQEVCGRTR